MSYVDVRDFGVLCIYETMLNYTEDGAEASGSEYAAGGSSGFEDEAYGDVSLAKNDSLPLIVEVEITYFPAIPPPTN